MKPGGIYWLASYPKSGNTWLRVFLRNLLADADQPADISALGGHPIASSRTWLEELAGFDISELTDAEVDEIRPAVYAWAARQPRVGYHKVHDAFGTTPSGVPLFPVEGCLGVVYVVRNPLDIVASLAHHLAISLEAAVDILNDPDYCWSISETTLAQQVRQRLMDWSGHVRSWLEAPGHRVHLVRYEDLLLDPEQSFAKIVKFLGLEERMQRLQMSIQYSAFSELSRQERQRDFPERTTASGNFFRRGQSGSWVRELSSEQAARVRSNHERTMRDLGYC